MHKRLGSLAGVMLLVAAATIAPGAQQPAAPQRGTALLIGRVVDESDRPLAGAIVTLSGAGVSDARVMVDSQGRFIYRSVPRGRFTITAELPGYVTGAYGKSRPDAGARDLDVADNQRITDLTVRLWRFASITGRVLDEAGEPITGASVEAFFRSALAGHQTRTNRGSVVPTDDRGVYTLSDLAPGNYVVAVPSKSITFPAGFAATMAAARAAGPASAAQLAQSMDATGASRLGIEPTMGGERIGDFLFANQYRANLVPAGPGRLTLYPMTFFPSATSPESATSIDLAAGDARAGVDVQLRAARGARVSGVVNAPNGPIANLGLRLQIADAAVFGIPSNLEIADTVTLSDGTFTFLGIPPGQYVAWTMTSPPPGSTDAALWATGSFAVGDADVKNVSLTLKPTLHVSGRVAWEGQTPPPPPARLAALPITFEPADGRAIGPPLFNRSRGVPVDADGRFISDGLLPGKYFVRVPAPPPGWSLKSAVVNGRDVSTDQPIALESSDVADVVITFTDRPLVVSGTARTSQGAGDGAAMVVLFPVTPQSWIDYGATPRAVRSAPAGRDGAFSISNVPAGDYFVAAIPDTVGSAWQDPAFMQRLGRSATRVHVDRDQTLDVVTLEIR